MDASSRAPAETARKGVQLAFQRLQEPGKAGAVAAAMGLSDSTVSRIKTERMEEVIGFLAHLGLKVVPAEFKCVDAIAEKPVTTGFAQVINGPTKQGLQWGEADAAPQGEAGTDALSTAARDVLAERQRQMGAEGWTPEHDDEHDSGELAAAASAYAVAAADVLHPLSQGDGQYTRGTPPAAWPWDNCFKPAPPRRMLVKAGALILAEIERIDRALAAQEAKR